MQVYSLLSVFVRNIQGLIKCIMLILLKFQAVSIMWLICNESWFAELLILKADDSFAKYIMLNFSISPHFPTISLPHISHYALLLEALHPKSLNMLMKN